MCEEKTLIAFAAAQGDGVEVEVKQALERFVDSGGAGHAALSLRRTAPGAEDAAPYDTELAVDGLVSLWDVSSTFVVRDLGLPATARIIGAFTAVEVVQRPIVATNRVTPGVNLLCFVAGRAGLTREQFHEHWSTRHGPLALQHQPGFQRYLQNQLVRSLVEDPPGWDGIGEILFATPRDVIDGMYASEESQQIIQEDMARFLDLDRITTLMATEHVFASTELSEVTR